MQQQQAPGFWERNRILIKGFLIGFLILIMLIPAAFVANLVNEREGRQAEVVNEVSSKWAEQQTVTGPILMLPCKATSSVNGKPVESMYWAYVLPDELHISGALEPKEKKRSLYSVLLYRSDVRITGKFNTLPLQALQIPPETVQWNEARLVMNVSDVRGIEDQVQLEWNGNKQSMDAGVPANKQLAEGLSAPVAVNAQNGASFAITVSLRGSRHLYFTPVGKTTEMDLSSNWKDPAFDGAYLPTISDVSDKGFKAHWKILPLSHTYPQYWSDAVQDLSKAAFGVRLIQPVDGYAKTTRSVKYAILFIALTFVCFFFLEILQKRQVHPLQYILVGLALTIFYTLLLSISEYIDFNYAYLVAAFATVALIGMYAWSMFRSGKTAFGFSLALATLYAFIFVLIQSEDYALLFGSIGLFVIIAIIMYFSRKIDWYGVTRVPQRNYPPPPPASYDQPQL